MDLIMFEHTDYWKNISNTTDVTTYASTWIANEPETPLWRTIIESIELGITIIGLTLNALTIVCLQKHRGNLSFTILRLLQHQSLLDAWICIMAIAIIFQPSMWTTGNATFDMLLCQVWHGQGMYWGCVLLSVYNLVLLAIERYMAVCRPYVHSRIGKRRVYIAHVIMYLLSIVLLIPAYLQTKYTPEGCQSEYFFDGEAMRVFMSVYGIFWFFLIYAIPCGLFLGFYGRVLYEARKMRRENQNVFRVMDRINSQLTRTFIIVTVLFAITLGWDSWYYLIGYLNIVEYNFNSPMQIFGVFLSVVNSCLNPVVYLLTMPVFRTSVRKTFACCSKMQKNRACNHISKLVGRSNPGFIIGIGYHCEMCSGDVIHLESFNIGLESCNGLRENKSDTAKQVLQDKTNIPDGKTIGNCRNVEAQDTLCDVGCYGHGQDERSSVGSVHHVFSISSSLVVAPLPNNSRSNRCLLHCIHMAGFNEHNRSCYQRSFSYCNPMPQKITCYRKASSLEE